MERRTRTVAAPAYSAEWAGIESFAFPTGTISVSCQDGEPVLRLAGEVDAAAVEAFDQSSAPPPGPHRRMAFSIIDVSQVRFIDCAGLTFIIRQSQATGERLVRPVLRHPPRPVRTILKLTGLESLFDSAP